MSSQMYQLAYFDLRGRGEPIRYIFKLAGKEFKDKRYSLEEFFEKKAGLPFGQLPVLFLDNGKDFICHHVSICRYIGHEFGFCGSNNLENAKLDMYADGANDLWPEFGLLYEADVIEDNPEKLKQLGATFVSGTFKAWADRYEGFLSAVPGDFLLGSKPTWADAYIAEFLNRILETMDKSCLDKHPKLQNFVKTFHEIPAIKEYVEKREFRQH